MLPGFFAAVTKIFYKSFVKVCKFVLYHFEMSNNCRNPHKQQTWAKGKVSCYQAANSSTNTNMFEWNDLQDQKYQHPGIEEDEEAHDSDSNHDDMEEILVQNYSLRIP